MPTTPDRARSLVEFSLASLATMYQDEAGLFCSYRDRAGVQYGVSPRYTLICLIGMHRAKTAGYEVPFDTEAIFGRVIDCEAPALADAGLRSWAASLYDPDRGPALAGALESQLSAEPDGARTGMDMGLALTGLAEHAGVSGDAGALERAADLRRQIALEYGDSPSGLFFHLPPGQLRRSKPNFATQIYLMHGLATESMTSGDPQGATLAEQCARALAALQRDDGGWPWIYDPSGAVVEDYEVYSVHQDAMAPMAFLALSDAGIDGMWPLVNHGLEWMYGRNGLNLDMVDAGRQLIYRSIRRPRLQSRVMLVANTASAAVANRAPLHAAGSVELNPTCRPYHLGWILEAWSGRVGPADPETADTEGAQAADV